MNTKLYYVENWLELAKKANWSVTKLAKLCDVSSRTLERYFFKTNGKTPKAWLSEQRQHKAMEFLRDGTPVKQTAAVLNYKYANHLSRDFKRYWGYCPTKTNSSGLDTKKLRVLV